MYTLNLIHHHHRRRHRHRHHSHHLPVFCAPQFFLSNPFHEWWKHDWFHTFDTGVAPVLPQCGMWMMWMMWMLCTGALCNLFEECPAGHVLLHLLPRSRFSVWKVWDCGVTAQASSHYVDKLAALQMLYPVAVNPQRQVLRRMVVFPKFSVFTPKSLYNRLEDSWHIHKIFMIHPLYEYVYTCMYICISVYTYYP